MELFRISKLSLARAQKEVGFISLAWLGLGRKWTLQARPNWTLSYPFRPTYLTWTQIYQVGIMFSYFDPFWQVYTLLKHFQYFLPLTNFTKGDFQASLGLDSDTYKVLSWASAWPRNRALQKKILPLSHFFCFQCSMKVW